MMFVSEKHINKSKNTRQSNILPVCLISLGVFSYSSISMATEVPKANIQETRKITIVANDYATDNATENATDNPIINNTSHTVNTTTITPQTTVNTTTYTPPPTQHVAATPTTSSVHTPSNEDSMAALIRLSEEKYQNQLKIERRTRIRPLDAYGSASSIGVVVNNLDFEQWLNVSPYRTNEVAQYQRYLAKHVGVYNVPPMNQLLTTARSWKECGFEEFQLPPRELWSNMVNTLKLYSDLKSQNILPKSTAIRSGYRSPELNVCAGGSSGSKHMTNGAIDVWIPEYHNDPWYIKPIQDNLCAYWATQGERHDFGLGLYPTGSIHLDTQGYRRWGENHTASSSVCQIGE